MTSILNEKSLQNHYLKQIEEYVIHQFTSVEAGHDLSHIQRVYKNAIAINKKEKADGFLVEAGVLLHDITDEKLFDKNKAESLLLNFLKSIQLKEDTISKLLRIIDNVSFGNSINNLEKLTLEEKVVRDADRLDAIGAVGIARAFQYGGHKNRVLINPETPPKLFKDKNEYRSNQGSTINHFYEKLLLLKDKMETSTGKEMAIERHEFMEVFLAQFYKEIDFVGFEPLS